MIRVYVENNEERFRNKVALWDWPEAHHLGNYDYKEFLVFAFVDEDDDVRAYVFFQDLGDYHLNLHFASYSGAEWFSYEAWRDLHIFLRMLRVQKISATPVGQNTAILRRMLRRMGFTESKPGVYHAALERIKHNGIFVQSSKAPAVPGSPSD